MVTSRQVLGNLESVCDEIHFITGHSAVHNVDGMKMGGNSKKKKKEGGLQFISSQMSMTYETTLHHCIWPSQFQHWKIIPQESEASILSTAKYNLFDA